MSPKENLQKPQGTCCRVASIQPTMARPSLLSCPWPRPQKKAGRPTAIRRKCGSDRFGNQKQTNYKIW
jgi:hypothetical protein